MGVFGKKHNFSSASQFPTRRFNRAGNIQIRIFNDPNSKHLNTGIWDFFVIWNLYDNISRKEGSITPVRV